MEFEWDEAKNKMNQIKHGVDFALMHTFDWDHASLPVDDRQNYGEERLLAYGPAGDGKLYVMVFTKRVTNAGLSAPGTLEKRIDIL